MADESIPDYLLQDPGGEPPEPPVDTAEQLLPFHGLTWENFERLCLRVARLEGEPEEVRLFGTRGQKQQGIDVYSRLADATYATYQCKDYEEVGASDIRNAVSEFLGGEWASRSSRFVFCTTASLVRTQLATEIETQAERLRSQTPSIRFELWDAENLSLKLKAHPDLVREFFGPAWLERFSQAQSPEPRDDRLDQIHATVDELLQRSYHQVRVVTLDWAPERLRRALLEYKEEHEALFARLTEEIGEPASAQRVVATIANPPQWAADADAGLWTVLARIAEDKGEWEAASRAWEASSERHDGAAKAADLVSAAVAAHVGGDDARHDALLDVARDADPEHPRVRLEALPEDASPAEQLAELDGLESDDPDTRMLIAARSALASLRLPDVDRALGYLQVAQEVGPDTALTQAVQANALVQKARLNLTASQSLDGPELRTAHTSALQVRARLLRQRRWEESARLLMLAADALALLDERKEAAQLLRQATPEERAAPDAAEVLGDCAASRVLDFRLALEFLEGAPESTVIKRIRAEAKEEVGTAAERAEALKVLEELVDADGDESTEAAFIRLAATLGGRRTPWSDSAAAYLREHGHERAAITAEVIYLARWHKDWPRIEALLEPHLDEMWAKVTRLRVAITRRQHTMIRDAADAVMVVGPSQAARIDAGRGYAMAGDYARAKEVLLGPAREPSAPPLLRAEAYRLLTRVVGHGLDDWQFATELHQEWVALRPTDTNASAWAPTIANRLRQT